MHVFGHHIKVFSVSDLSHDSDLIMMSGLRVSIRFVKDPRLAKID